MNVTFDVTLSGMLIPLIAIAKAKRLKTALDRDNIRVNKTLKGIPDLKAFSKV